MAVVGASLGAKLFGGGDPVGRDVVIEGVPYRIVGVLASGQIFNEEMWQDANGMLVPLETYMDRLDAERVLRGQRGGRARAVYAKCGEGLEVCLDTRAARGIRAGDGESNGGHWRQPTLARPGNSSSIQAEISVMESVKKRTPVRTRKPPSTFSTVPICLRKRCMVLMNGRMATAAAMKGMPRPSE